MIWSTRGGSHTETSGLLKLLPCGVHVEGGGVLETKMERRKWEVMTALVQIVDGDSAESPDLMIIFDYKHKEVLKNLW